MKLGVYGTKMRSVINILQGTESPPWWHSSSRWQRIAEHGLMPIIEPEVSIKSPDKQAPRTSCWRS